MIGYNTLYKSMNGIRVLSDGISMITDGNATHDDIIYNDTIKSKDSKTILINNKITTEIINALNFEAGEIIVDTGYLDNIFSKYLQVNNILNDPIIICDGLNNFLTISTPSTFNNKIDIINNDIHQTQTGKLYQQGTGENYLKDTYINGYLTIGSNLTQNGGSASLKALTVDTITQNPNKGITQSGDVSNNFGGTTQMKNVIITDSIIFPSNVEIPQTTTSEDILMNSDSVITQDITTITTKFNNFRDTRTLNLIINGDITQIKGNGLTTLKNIIIQGLSELQGDITQTAGTTILKTLRCNNITLNDDQIITLSGSGYITQSGTGSNTLKEINLLNNNNLIFNGNGIISQPVNGINILSHFRSAGFGIIGGRNNTTYTNYQNIQNNNGFQIQFNRDNSSLYSYLMNNRSTGGNGGFRFQRYIGGVYIDEPLIIDDNITMNKNLSIPSGSISCSSATIGNISQTEINCLDNLTQNINDKFTSYDSLITSLSNSNNNNNLALTGITYNINNDTTTIDNNLTVSSGKTFLIGTTNIINSLNNINSTLSGISYDQPNDLTTINNHVILPNGNNLLLGSINVKTSIENSNLKLSGISYDSTNDTTTIDNNLIVSKSLIVNGNDINAQINALETSFTTGTINSTDLTTTHLTIKDVNNNKTTLTHNDNGFMIQNDTVDSWIYLNGQNYNNTQLISYLTLSADRSSFYTPLNILSDCTISGKLFANGDIATTVLTVNDNIMISKTKNLTQNYNIQFPISEYHILTQSLNISAVLPAIELNKTREGAHTTFLLSVKNASCLISVATGSNLYDMNCNIITNILLSDTTNQSIKFNVIGKHWYITNIVNFNNPTYSNISVSNNTTSNSITSTSLTSLTGNIDEITNMKITSNDVITNNLSASSLRTNLYVQNDKNIIKRELTAGYMLNGPNGGRQVPVPILSSQKYLYPDNDDDAYIVNAGYEFICYEGDNYTGNSIQFNNSDGIMPQHFIKTLSNVSSSIKVYFRGTEITYPYLS